MCGIIGLGGAPPPIASSNQNLSCNLTLSSPGQRLEFIQCFQQICIWLRNKLYICGWTEAVWLSWWWENIKEREEADYDKTKFRVTRSWNSKRDLGFLPGFKIIGGVTWGLFLSRKGGDMGSRVTRHSNVEANLGPQVIQVQSSACLPGLLSCPPSWGEGIHEIRNFFS